MTDNDLIMWERQPGDEEHRVGGKLHRLDGPAVITRDGHEMWARDGKPHRDPDAVWTDGPGGPACTNGITGDLEWWFDGEMHRTDGPAYTGKHIGYYLHGNVVDRFTIDELRVERRDVRDTAAALHRRHRDVPIGDLIAAARSIVAATCDRDLAVELYHPGHGPGAAIDAAKRIR